MLVATATVEDSLSPTPGSSNTVLTTGSVAASASNTYYATFLLASGPGTLDWPATVSDLYDVVLDVTTCTSTVTGAGNPQRLDITTAAQRASSVPLGVTGTGLKSFGLTGSGWSSLNSSALRATTDVYMVAARVSNSSSMTAGSYALRVDNSNVTALVPWTVSGGGPTPLSPPFALADRRIRRNSLLRR